MANESGKLYAAQKAYATAQKGKGKSPASDEELNEKRKNRSYNPLDDAKTANTSAELNKDSAQYRKGPGPL